MNVSADLDAMWQPVFLRLLGEHTPNDAAHDLEHIRRVVANARRIGSLEGADWEILMPAAWLHDCVHVAKSSPDRKRASQLAAEQAVEWLEEARWPYGKLEQIFHSIEAHSFSAGIETRTLEARVLQDADRHDALGAVGLARTLMLGAEMKREFYDARDPFCAHRDPDDSVYTLDHVYAKLLKLEDTMKTGAGRSEARERTGFLRVFLRQMEKEVSGTR